MGELDCSATWAREDRAAHVEVTECSEQLKSNEEERM